MNHSRNLFNPKHAEVSNLSHLPTRFWNHSRSVPWPNIGKYRISWIYTSTRLKQSNCRNSQDKCTNNELINVTNVSSCPNRAGISQFIKFRMKFVWMGLFLPNRIEVKVAFSFQLQTWPTRLYRVRLWLQLQAETFRLGSLTKRAPYVDLTESTAHSRFYTIKPSTPEWNHKPNIIWPIKTLIMTQTFVSITLTNAVTNSFLLIRKKVRRVIPQERACKKQIRGYKMAQKWVKTGKFTLFFRISQFRGMTRGPLIMGANFSVNRK